MTSLLHGHSSFHGGFCSTADYANSGSFGNHHHHSMVTGVSVGDGHHSSLVGQDSVGGDHHHASLVGQDSIGSGHHNVSNVSGIMSHQTFRTEYPDGLLNYFQHGHAPNPAPEGHHYHLSSDHPEYLDLKIQGVDPKIDGMSLRDAINSPQYAQVDHTKMNAWMDSQGLTIDQVPYPNFDGQDIQLVVRPIDNLVIYY